MQLPDGRTLTKQRDSILRGVDDNGWEIRELGRVEYFIDGEPIDPAEAEALIAAAEAQPGTP